MNKHNLKSGLLFVTSAVFAVAFIVIFLSGFFVTPVNAETTATTTPPSDSPPPPSSGGGGGGSSTNQPPTLSGLGQFDGATSIPEGWILRHPYISSFSANVSDPDGDQVKLQVELRRFEELFTGVEDGGILTSDQVPSGDDARVPEWQLSCGCRLAVQLPDGKYHWRARAVDSHDNKSAWQEFKIVGNVDFEIRTKIPVIIVPGIVGSRLFNFTDGEEAWPNASKMRSQSDDSYLDALKLNSDGSQIKEVHPTGIILEEFTEVYYKNLVDSFTNAGYTLGENLFLRPYDWRLDINHELVRLGNTVQQAISKSPNGKIDIVAHSLGGLLVKTYLNQLSNTSFVNKFVLIASPQLGAPKAFKALNYGDNLGFSLFGKDILNTDRVKEITQNMPGIYELLPSQRYVQVNGGYVKDFRNNQTKILDYEQTNQFMFEKERNPDLLDVAKNFHSSLDSSPINAPKIYNIVGCQNPKTITGFRVYDDGKDDIETSDGDGTVPLTSAINLSGGYTANYFVNYNITGGFSGTGIDHLGLVRDKRAVDLIKKIITGETINLPNGFSTAFSYCSLRPYDPTMLLASIHSPAALHVYDSQGRHTGPLPNGDTELGILGSSYEKIGENSFAFVPAGDNYRFVADSLASGTFDMKVRTYHGNDLTDTITYLSVPLASDKTNAELDFTNNQSPPNLQLDSNGDGIFETIIQPTAILDETLSADIAPPQILINSPTNTDYIHSQSIPINVAVTDTESGVVLTETKLDGIIFTGSTIDSFFEKLGDHQLTVHAVDRIGNPSNLTTTFRIIATPESTISDIERAYALGWIDNVGVKESLVKKLREAVKTKIDKVLAIAFLSELEAQKNKHINDQVYQLIKGDVGWLMSH